MTLPTTQVCCVSKAFWLLRKNARQSSWKGITIWACAFFKTKQVGLTRAMLIFCVSPSTLHFFFSLEGFRGQPQGPNFPSSWATMLALRLDCPSATLTTTQKFLSLWSLVELKMIVFSDPTGSIIDCTPFFYKV